MKPIIMAMLINSSPVEAVIIDKVAREYKLTTEQTALLVAIRLAENGRDGVEFGVERKQAQRFRGDFPKSLKLQASWCAGTISKRYTGDLVQFCDKAWIPEDRENWLHNVRHFMARMGYRK